MTRVVLTGFGRFEGVAVNPAEAGVLDAGLSLYTHPDLDLVVEILPVEFDRARRRVEELAGSLRPDLWVGFGVAVGSTAVRVERGASNLMDARVPDNAGVRPAGEPVHPGGRDVLASSLPVEAVVDALRAVGVDAEASGSAGTFVCNAVFYTALRALAGAEARIGFVHLPPGLAAPDEVVKTVVRAALA